MRRTIWEGAFTPTAPGAMSFSAGTFNIGTVTTTSNCNSTTNYSICLAGQRQG